jgi:hypothetical protein
MLVLEYSLEPEYDLEQKRYLARQEDQAQGQQ